MNKPNDNLPDQEVSVPQVPEKDKASPPTFNYSKSKTISTRINVEEEKRSNRWMILEILLLPITFFMKT